VLLATLKTDCACLGNSAQESKTRQTPEFISLSWLFAKLTTNKNIMSMKKNRV
jgi:hypothetical protein